ncbi:thioredoxin family protein [Streptomyces sp. NBC_00209]|uniref:thioredoxin family protein n=1 Tax=Streptomyces sp. NBC_00209 TaxID=2975682 RepID=UPI003248F3EB
MAAAPIDTTDATFSEQVLDAAGPVLVMFWAEWSGPCKMVLPLMDSAAADYAGRLTVARHNIDHQPATAPQQDVTGLPTLILIKGGAEIGRKVGALSEGQLTEFLDARL